MDKEEKLFTSQRDASSDDLRQPEPLGQSLKKTKHKTWAGMSYPKHSDLKEPLIGKKEFELHELISEQKGSRKDEDGGSLGGIPKSEESKGGPTEEREIEPLALLTAATCVEDAYYARRHKHRNDLQSLQYGSLSFCFFFT